MTYCRAFFYAIVRNQKIWHFFDHMRRSKAVFGEPQKAIWERILADLIPAIDFLVTGPSFSGLEKRIRILLISQEEYVDIGIRFPALIFSVLSELQ